MKLRLSWKTGATLLGCGCALSLPFVTRSAAAAEPSSIATGRAAARAKNMEARNLARAANGAQIEVQVPGQKIPAEEVAVTNALLRDDDPLGYELQAGTTNLIISLSRIEVLNRFNFLNLTASGKVSVAISSAKLPPDSPRWRSIQEMDFSGENGVVTCDLGSVEAKYVRLTFDEAAEGRIDTLGLYGQRTLSDSTNARGLAAKRTGSGGPVYVLFNYAVDSPHAGVVMISPGEDLEQAQQMADGDVGTEYAFKASDPAPMAVIDLGESRQLTRVGAAFKAGPGRMAIYLVPDPRREGAAADLPGVGKRASAKTIEDVITTDFPGGRTPVLAVDTGTQPGLNRVGANVNGESGRYLVMTFHPNGMPAANVPAAGGADFKDFKDDTDFKDVDGGRKDLSEAPVGNEPLQVSEITGFGNIPPGTNLTTNTPILPPPTSPPGGPVPPPIAPPGAGTITP